jgi:uncharacterized protein (DUF58 family)
VAQIPTGQTLLDTPTLEKLERLTIHWKKSLPGLVGGHNTSRFAGGGQEFLDHRHFHHGDDLRAVNWRAYLRLEKLFLKMFQLEPRIPVRILLDVSQSMVTGKIPKFDYARKLAAALCYVGLVRLDSICLQPFASKLHDSFTAGGGRHRFQPAMNFLTGLKPGGQTDFLAVAREFISEYPQKGLLLIISDFLDNGDSEKPVQYLADFGHELILLQLWADEDRDPPWDGELDLEDAETGQHMELAFDAESRARYTAEFDRYADHMEHVALRNEGRYLGLSTSVPLEQAIFGSLIRSGALQ